MSFKSFVHGQILGTKICAIVDALFTSGLLAREFRKRGYRSIHIQSLSDQLPYFKAAFRSQDFIENIRHDGNIERTLEHVQAFRPAMLLAGVEESVGLADSLAERMGLAGNGVKWSEARQNKYLMHERLRDCGVSSIPQAISDDLGELLRWIRQNAAYPIVVKPPCSSGTDGVTLCFGEDEVKNTFHRLIGKENQLTVVNREVLVQTKISGTEYIVNTASHDGTTKLTDIWKSVKTKANEQPFLYDHLELIDLESKTAQILFDYVKKVLPALGVRYGPAHCEVMMTDTGPILIEMGARLCGGFGNHSLAHDLLGMNQIEWTCEAYADPEAFVRRSNPSPKRPKHCRLVCLISKKEGVIRAIPGIEKVQRLPSYHGHWLGVEIGMPLRKTVDLVTAPADIGLVHDDPGQIERDYQEIRNIEEEGFFTLVP